MINAASSPSAGSAQVWTKASAALRQELGDDAFGSWLAPAALQPQPDGALCLVTPTGIARDWIRRHAWRRVEELWAANDPDHRPLCLKSRVEFEASNGTRAECSNEPARGHKPPWRLARRPNSRRAAPGLCRTG